MYLIINIKGEIKLDVWNRNQITVLQKSFHFFFHPQTKSISDYFMERKKQKMKCGPNEIKSHRLGVFTGGHGATQVMGRGHVTMYRVCPPQVASD